LEHSEHQWVVCRREGQWAKHRNLYLNWDLHILSIPEQFWNTTCRKCRCLGDSKFIATANRRHKQPLIYLFLVIDAGHYNSRHFYFIDFQALSKNFKHSGNIFQSNRFHCEFVSIFAP
jgi:hypothetical protein